MSILDFTLANAIQNQNAIKVRGHDVHTGVYNRVRAR